MEVTTPTAPQKPRKLTTAEIRRQHLEEQQRKEQAQLDLVEKILQAMKLVEDKEALIIQAISTLDNHSDFITCLITDDHEDIEIKDSDATRLREHLLTDQYEYIKVPSNMSDAMKLKDFIESQGWIDNDVPAMAELL